MDQNIETHFAEMLKKQRKTVKIGDKTYELGKVYNNPYATAFKSSEQITAEEKENK
jgi:ribosomal protein S24E